VLGSNGPSSPPSSPQGQAAAATCAPRSIAILMPRRMSGRPFWSVSRDTTASTGRPLGRAALGSNGRPSSLRSPRLHSCRRPHRDAGSRRQGGKGG
jgi:hypothetical protein